MTTSKTDSVSAIDAAIAKAQAKKALRVASGDATASETDGTKAASTKAPKATDAEKAAKALAVLAERAEAKAKRDLEREAKRAEKAAAAKPAHLSKVERAASKLPTLSERAEAFFNESTVNLSKVEVANLSAHLAHFNRASSTQAATGAKLNVGDSVRIVSGAPKFIGMIGTVAKSQRIRCYVTVEGHDKDVYLFTSDVEFADNDMEATGTNG